MNFFSITPQQNYNTLSSNSSLPNYKKICTQCKLDRPIKTFHSNPLDRSVQICHSCFMRIKKEQTAAEGIKCPRPLCKSNKAVNRWYKNPEEKSELICRLCFESIKKNKKLKKG